MLPLWEQVQSSFLPGAGYPVQREAPEWYELISFLPVLIKYPIKNGCKVNQYLGYIEAFFQFIFKKDQFWSIMTRI
jgi:hypothetical protein